MEYDLVRQHNIHIMMHLFGGALTGYGGTDFFTALVLGAPGYISPRLVEWHYECPTKI